MLNNNKIALAVILGSGILIDDNIISDKVILSEERSGVHRKIIFECTVAGKNVIVFKGRKHFYEGFGINDITANIRYAEKLGVKNILITNAAGGLNENYSVGELMLITSHINFITKLKFKPVNVNYKNSLAEEFRNCCTNSGVKLHEGTYGCYSGPTYETAAEIKFQKKFMLDAAGMSTVPESITCAASGINVIAVSVITNLLKESPPGITSHSDVVLNASGASESFNKVLPCFISQLKFC